MRDALCLHFMNTRVFLRAAAVSLALFASIQAVAETIGIVGSNSSGSDGLIEQVLSDAGYTVQFSPSDYSGLSAVVLIRTPGDDALKDFVASGGLLITEWDAADWVLNTAQMLGTTRDIDGGYVDTGTVITFTDAASAAGLTRNVGASYSENSSTEFFRFFAPIDPAATVYATYDGGTPAILGGHYGAGAVLVLGYDWADEGFALDGPTANIIINSLNFSPIPEPSTYAAFAGAGVLGLAIWRRRSLRSK